MAAVTGSADDRVMTINAFLHTTSILDAYARDELLARETGLWL
jgi:hypothetical protein